LPEGDASVSSFFTLAGLLAGETLEASFGASLVKASAVAGASVA